LHSLGVLSVPSAPPQRGLVMTEAMPIAGVKTDRNSRGLDSHASRWSRPGGAQWPGLRAYPALHALGHAIFLSPDRVRPAPTIGALGRRPLLRCSEMALTVHDWYDVAGFQGKGRLESLHTGLGRLLALLTSQRA
jgi:hypothetical protein